ncbi:TnsA endonuclease N-terminal domain-containing protein [Kistimonas scapharcae]|uniref:TnsA endonuclease N-terminal domain-containing protein n=2 Tax=Kistimonas scapharcae TaxID=1036133 RepID=A0ABP8V0I6_9GAMM
MQKKRRKVTEKDVERWIKEWLELVENGEYKPWLEVREVPSIGRSRKVKGIKTGHIHHFLSDLEYYIYLMLEYDSSVTAIYEQYPLLPRNDTIEIANMMGIRHPVYPQSSTPIVYSTDFVIEQRVASGEIIRKAITAKYSTNLATDKKETKRKLHLMEMERLAHAKNGIDLKCITEKAINKNMIYNLKWFIQDAALDNELVQFTKDWASLFKHQIMTKGEAKLSSILKEISEAMKITYENSVRLFRHNMWNQTLKTDISEKIELTNIIKASDYFII